MGEAGGEPHGGLALRGLGGAPLRRDSSSGCPFSRLRSPDPRPPFLPPFLPILSSAGETNDDLTAAHARLADAAVTSGLRVPSIASPGGGHRASAEVSGLERALKKAREAERKARLEAAQQAQRDAERLESLERELRLAQEAKRAYARRACRRTGRHTASKR